MARSPNPPTASPPSRSTPSSITRPPAGTFRRRRWRASSGATRMRRRWPPKHYPRARPLAEGETRTAEEPSQPELIWNGAQDHHHRRADEGAGRDRHAHPVRRATRLARQGPAGLVRPRRQRAAALHPGEDPPQGDHRRPEAPHGREARGGDRRARPVRRLQRHRARISAPSSTSTTSTGRTA